MKAFGVIALVVLAIVGGFVAWWIAANPVYTYRFRLAIEVEVDGETRSGASVLAVRTVDQRLGLTEAKGARSQVTGEAVFLDLGNGRNVIATLGFGPHANDHKIERLVLLAFLPSHPQLTIEDIPKLTGSAPLTGDLIPTLVSFADLNDPSTARVVRPDQFETVFGPGVRFRRSFIEMTRDPVTRGIEQKVAFLRPMRDVQKGKSVLVYPEKLNVIPPLFVRE